MTFSVGETFLTHPGASSAPADCRFPLINTSAHWSCCIRMGSWRKRLARETCREQTSSLKLFHGFQWTGYFLVGCWTLSTETRTVLIIVCDINGTVTEVVPRVKLCAWTNTETSQGEYSAFALTQALINEVGASRRSSAWLHLKNGNEVGGSSIWRTGGDQICAAESRVWEDVADCPGFTRNYFLNLRFFPSLQFLNKNTNNLFDAVLKVAEIRVWNLKEASSISVQLF